MNMNHEVNLISVLVHPARGVLLQKAGSGKWGFPGSEDLIPGEAWETAQLRGLNRDLNFIDFVNVSFLHLESYPAGMVAPNSKFGVFVLATTDSSTENCGLVRWVNSVEDVQELDLIHARVLQLVEKALEMKGTLLSQRRMGI